jgi:hypothetical protein
MSFEDVEFWRLRERQERAAAKQATDVSIRRAHQELAAQYSLLILDATVQRELVFDRQRAA